MLFKFDVINTDGFARRGLLKTPHGDVETPTFMPVGTQATVKSLGPDDIKATGSTMILANTYHCYLRPGADIVAAHGGLHSFMKWDGPILTDSGGYQIFSLENLRDISIEGVTFKSHIDGSLHSFTPESIMDIQEKLGADFIMTLDECPPHTSTEEKISKSLDLTLNWAKRCLDSHKREDQKLLGIIQGGFFPEYRQKALEKMVEMDFWGYSLGGLSVGEEKEKMHSILSEFGPKMPDKKLRYLMGVGTPEDFLFAISSGIDIFDCVMPTRAGRNGTLFTWQGRKNILRSEYKDDLSPLDEKCSCYTCKNFTKSYLRHLFLCKELLAYRLATLHNVTFFQEFMAEVRNAISNNKFDNFCTEWKEK